MPSISTNKTMQLAETVVLYLVDTACFERIHRLGELDFLSAKQRSRAATMSEKRSREYQLSRWLVRRSLAQAMPDIPRNNIRILDQKDLPPKSPQAETAGQYFSISHSANKLGVAITRVGPVGLDLEHIGKKRKFLHTAQQFCTPLEFATLENAEPLSARPQLFYQLWTQKEAWLKSRSLGIGAVSMAKIHFRPTDKNSNPKNNSDCIATCFSHNHFQFAIVCHRRAPIHLIELNCGQCISESAAIQPPITFFSLQSRHPD